MSLATIGNWDSDLGKDLPLWPFLLPILMDAKVIWVRGRWETTRLTSHANLFIRLLMPNQETRITTFLYEMNILVTLAPEDDKKARRVEYLLLIGLNSERYEERGRRPMHPVCLRPVRPVLARRELGED